MAYDYLYSDVEHLSKYSPVTLNLSPVTSICNENPGTRDVIRVFTKISSCGVNTTSRRGIKRLGIFFGSIFLLFSKKSSWGPLS